MMRIAYFPLSFAVFFSSQAFFLVGTLRAQVHIPGSGNDTVAVAIRDNNERIACDAIHLQIPQGWSVRGRIAWGLTALSPVKQIISVSNPSGPELWMLYPGASFVWRDNFDLFGLQFRPNPGDADLATGEEIERPLFSATDIIKQVLVARYRPDLAQATVVSVKEYSDAESLDLVRSLTPASVEASDPLIRLAHRAAMVRFEYLLNNQPMQEDLFCLALYADIPSASQGVLHLWQIDYATSFRAEKGRLDGQESAIGSAIQSSLKIDPQWQKKAADLQQSITQLYAQRLQDLAAARMSDIRARASRAIFQMAQQSYQRRTQMQAAQVHDMSNALRGMTDYTAGNGQTLEAPLAPFGKEAWLGPDGRTYFFTAGNNPGAGYQPLSPK